MAENTDTEAVEKINEAMREMTMALMFLSRFTEQTKKDKKLKEPWSAWKGYDWDVLDELSEKDFIRCRRKSKSAILTPRGMDAARRFLASIGVPDWPSLKGFADWPEGWESLLEDSDATTKGQVN